MFVEVKTRSSEEWARPAAAVDAQEAVVVPDGTGLPALAEESAGADPLRYRRGAAQRRRSARSAAFAEHISISRGMRYGSKRRSMSADGDGHNRRYSLNAGVSATLPTFRRERTNFVNVVVQRLGAVRAVGAFQPALVQRLGQQIQRVRSDGGFFLLAGGVADADVNPASNSVTRMMVLREYVGSAQGGAGRAVETVWRTTAATTSRDSWRGKRVEEDGVGFGQCGGERLREQASGNRRGEIASSLRAPHCGTGLRALIQQRPGW